MIIGIDGNEANVKNRVGINVYAFELLHALQKLADNLAERHNLIVYLKSSPLPDMPEEGENFKYKVIPSSGMWILTKLWPHLLSNPDRIEVFFAPSHYLPPFLMIPSVCTITDLGYLKFPAQFKKYDYWQLRLWSAISIFVAKYLITISNSSKEDIVRRYGFSAKKVFVTTLSYVPEKNNEIVSVENVRQIKNKYSIVSDYIIYIGTLKPSKNIEGLIDAYVKVLKVFPKVQLVIVGKKGWLFDSIFNKVEDLKLKDNIIFTDFISEGDKNILLKNSKVFVLPSFWEGFGLDLLQALNFGVPVVASNVASIPEVVGGFGKLVDPKFSEDIAKAIVDVLSLSKRDYNELSLKGKKHAAKFSWDKTAEQTLRVLELATK